jgi:hypothetical protein
MGLGEIGSHLQVPKVSGQCKMAGFIYGDDKSRISYTKKIRTIF